ncbi:NAD(P)H-quinone oxidoreductase [Sabulibacter ruber]|uniref:NAD(P)H-quinone oxidoreductase n=1 Tax=Sabulibacter ruber TaxID=2811901 RepID=UPI001A964CB7|nr:NAD(P)H-quinone oxidoreductase [Sabulibacter ruber]
MKAVVITTPGAPDVLQVQEKDMPSSTAQQVLIKVKAAGINRPDVAQRKGNYPPPAGAPVDIPGLEVAGIIEACGDEVQRWQLGDAVCALLPGGGYAEYAVVDARHCLPVPSGWSFEEAASLPETVFTVWHNVFQRGKLQPGESLLVHGGSSGIGITAIQLAKAWGARVFATAGSPEKCAACEALGAERCINYKTEDFEEILKTEGVDVVLDMVGGNYIPKNLNLLKPDGQLVFINAMQGAKGEFNVMQVMQKRLSISGSTLRPRDAEFKALLTADIEKHVWPLLEAGKFRPVIYQTFSLQEAAQAHALMESSEHIGKIVLSIA